MVRVYGTGGKEVLGGHREVADLREDFGATLSEAGVRWPAGRERVRPAQDVAWRRSKFGLRMAAEEVDGLVRWLKKGTAAPSRVAADYLKARSGRSFSPLLAR